MMPRRKFFQVGAASVVTVLGLGYASNVYLKASEPSEWGSLIKKLQSNCGPAKDGKTFKKLKGYEYDVIVDGRPVHAYLSKVHWEGGHELRYDIDGSIIRVNAITSIDYVCVYSINPDSGGEIPITDEQVVANAENLTTLVLRELVKHQKQLCKEVQTKALETARKNLVYK